MPSSVWSWHDHFVDELLLDKAQCGVDITTTFEDPVCLDLAAVLSGAGRTGPPDGGLPVPPDRAGSFGAWQTDRRGGFSVESAATSLPGSAQHQDLAKSVWQEATVTLLSVSTGPSIRWQ